MKIAGIDEAGRGPVIGPMVMSITVLEEADLPKLKSMGVKDSKLLSVPQRNYMFGQVKELTINDTIIIQPKQIDEAVLSESSNLNWLEADIIIKLVNKHAPDRVYVDCPSTNIEAYTNYLKEGITTKTEIIAEHKADLTYPVVSAASILAKVTRDNYIEGIKKNIKQDFGSGYPSDPKTQKFLKENWDKHNFFRKSWSSYRKVAASEGQKKLGEF